MGTKLACAYFAQVLSRDGPLGTIDCVLRVLFDLGYSLLSIRCRAAICDSLLYSGHDDGFRGISWDICSRDSPLKFSIVTISFNQARFLEQAICSVIEQDYPDIEYIIVDPGSTDGSRRIIEKYADKLNNIIFEKDEGPADGLNKGFARATGDVYGHLNADDVLLPGTITKAANFFKFNKIIDIVSGHCYVIDERGVILHKIFSHKFDLRRYYAGSCILVQQSTFFRSNIFNKTEGFNVQNKVSWDGELAVDFALQGARFAVVHDYWSCFRVYSQSISGSSEYMNCLKKEHIRIKGKISFDNISNLKKKYLWFTGWLLQPKTLTLRIIDGLINRKRLM